MVWLIALIVVLLLAVAVVVVVGLAAETRSEILKNDESEESDEIGSGDESDEESSDEAADDASGEEESSGDRLDNAADELKTALLAKQMNLLDVIKLLLLALTRKDSTISVGAQTFAVEQVLAVYTPEKVASISLVDLLESYTKTSLHTQRSWDLAQILDSPPPNPDVKVGAWCCYPPEGGLSSMIIAVLQERGCEFEICDEKLVLTSDPTDIADDESEESDEMNSEEENEDDSGGSSDESNDESSDGESEDHEEEEPSCVTEIGKLLRGLSRIQVEALLQYLSTCDTSETYYRGLDLSRWSVEQIKEVAVPLGVGKPSESGDSEREPFCDSERRGWLYNEAIEQMEKEPSERLQARLSKLNRVIEESGGKCFTSLSFGDGGTAWSFYARAAFLRNLVQRCIELRRLAKPDPEAKEATATAEEEAENGESSDSAVGGEAGTTDSEAGETKSADESTEPVDEVETVANHPRERKGKRKRRR